MTNTLELFEKMVPALPVKLASREGIMYMQSVLEGVPDNSDWEDKFPLTHRFADGVYAREMLIPAGHLIIGKIHRYGHLNLISKGHVAVLTEFGVEEFTGPVTFISQPGTKRVVFAYEDTVWTTFHGTKRTTPEEVEEDIICKSFDEYDRFKLLEDKP